MKAVKELNIKNIKSKDRLFLGLDLSTQSLKATIVTEDLSVFYRAIINYDQDLPEFKTDGGVYRDPDGETVASPVLMWVGALDLLLSKIKDDSVPISNIVAISGAAQQHASVWVRENFESRLKQLDPGSTLREQLDGVFSLKNSPIWMDSSTKKQCEELEVSMGGPQALADLTGSRAYERFTGNQIAKVSKDQPNVYMDTKRILLASSLMASLFLGSYSPVDASDGSGMNLMNIWSMQWEKRVLLVTAPMVEKKLGPIVPSHRIVGPLHYYYVKRYGFLPSCCIIAFSGDNPNSLAGLCFKNEGDLVISLGTSDTMFASLENPKPSAQQGHIFVNPIIPRAFMAMIARKNGSFAREMVRNNFTDGKWSEFNSMLEESPPGNRGNIGMYILEPEITPPITKTGIYRFDVKDRAVEVFTPHENVRAIIEGQFLSLSIHAEKIGIRPLRLIATGGASANTSILKIVANIFGKPVYVAEQADSASLGAAYRAKHGLECTESNAFIPFGEIIKSKFPHKEAAVPDLFFHKKYKNMQSRFQKLEQLIAGI